MDEISDQINTLIIKRDRKLLGKIRKDNNLNSLNKNACFADIESEYNQAGNQDQYVDNTSMPGISEIEKNQQNLQARAKAATQVHHQWATSQSIKFKTQIAQHHKSH